MKHPLCPKCKSEKIALIFYGYPANMDEYLKGIEDGTYAPGGCCVSDDDPKWFCNSCRNEFGNRFSTLEELSQK